MPCPYIHAVPRPHMPRRFTSGRRTASPIACVAHRVRRPSSGRPAGSSRHAVPPPRNNVTPVGARHAVPLHTCRTAAPHAAPVHVGATRCVARRARRPSRASPIVGATRRVAPTCRAPTPQQRNPRRGTACRAPTYMPYRGPTCRAGSRRGDAVRRPIACVAHCVRCPYRALPIACVAHRGGDPPGRPDMPSPHPATT
ncbi:MAG: hypothetical protein KatS3mg051_2050 [Anaerolineae bacterium]|nr:MAG: hypothetical protein KatS3mg051_2050 [Anaerolineae bacterium]